MRVRAECSHGPIVRFVGEATSIPSLVGVSRNRRPLALMRKIGLAGYFMDGIEKFPTSVSSSVTNYNDNRRFRTREISEKVADKGVCAFIGRAHSQQTRLTEKARTCVGEHLSLCICRGIDIAYLEHRVGASHSIGQNLCGALGQEVFRSCHEDDGCFADSVPRYRRCRRTGGRGHGITFLSGCALTRPRYRRSPFRSENTTVRFSDDSLSFCF